MNPVIQEEKTGCAIACAAAIAGISYAEAKQIANSLGIFAADPTLWSTSDAIRRLLKQLGIETGHRQVPFSNWDELPDLALLAIKWHQVDGRPFWHWVVFVREDDRCYVLDSKKALKTHRRTDFGRIKPKWFMEVFP